MSFGVNSAMESASIIIFITNSSPELALKIYISI